VVEHGLERTGIHAEPTLCALVLHKDDDAFVINHQSVGWARLYTLRFSAMPANIYVKLVFGHILGHHNSGQTRVAFSFMEEGAGQGTNLATVA